MLFGSTFFFRAFFRRWVIAHHQHGVRSEGKFVNRTLGIFSRLSAVVLEYFGACSPS